MTVVGNFKKRQVILAISELYLLAIKEFIMPAQLDWKYDIPDIVVISLLWSRIVSANLTGSSKCQKPRFWSAVCAHDQLKNMLPLALKHQIKYTYRSSGFYFTSKRAKLCLSH